MFSRFLIALAVTLAPGWATAASVDWEKTVSVSVPAGPENPLVIFGFNPQPEPPALVAQTTLDPTAALREVLGVEPTPFQLYLAAGGGMFTTGFQAVDAVGLPGLLGFDVGFMTDLGTDLTLELRFVQNGSGSVIDADALFFNPQPEPPALSMDDSLGAEISFLNLVSGDDVGVSLQFTDANGRVLPIAAGPAAVIPLPAAAWLMLGALGLLGGLRARRRA
ncbi:hypothetical protein [Dinoroseobacter sp. S76]|uniref:hypothetical protein n=1 Tax=Dinoroseobacter sp. S76 TaxID=3415124 RepID=UPI003C7A809E